jgi:hypothetical protein
VSKGFPTYPEIISCFNKVKNGRRVYPEQIVAMHTKKFGVEPNGTALKNFFKRLPNRGVNVIRQDGNGEYYKLKAINPQEAFRISIPTYSYEKRLWE